MKQLKRFFKGLAFEISAVFNTIIVSFILIILAMYLMATVVSPGSDDYLTVKILCITSGFLLITILIITSVKSILKMKEEDDIANAQKKYNK